MKKIFKENSAVGSSWEVMLCVKNVEEWQNGKEAGE